MFVTEHMAGQAIIDANADIIWKVANQALLSSKKEWWYIIAYVVKKVEPLTLTLRTTSIIIRH